MTWDPRWREMTVQAVRFRAQRDYLSGGDLAWRYMQAWRDVDFLLALINAPVAEPDELDGQGVLAPAGHVPPVTMAEAQEYGRQADAAGRRGLALGLLDVIDAIVDDTHPEGDGCPLCTALDDLRGVLADA